MLPHIVHSTTRAVAVVQNQSHALRNVLQLQGPSSGSGSSWGNGPGPGGSKYNPGSRYHSTYNSAGRAVTQANAITSQDGQNGYNDEDETRPRPTRARIHSTTPRRTRARSSSVSLSLAERHERGETLGVLQTVQMHTRARQVFGPAETLAAAKQRLLSEHVQVFDDAEDNSRPLRVRRNSTSAPLSPLLDPASPPPVPPAALEPLEPPVSESKAQKTETANRPAKSSPSSPESDRSLPIPSTTSLPSRETTFAASLRELEKLGDYRAVQIEVRRMLTSLDKPSRHLFNIALFTLCRTRPEGQDLSDIHHVYNAMLERGVLPDTGTYNNLIYAFTSREFEVHQAIRALQLRNKRMGLVGRTEVANEQADEDRIAALRQEGNFVNAMSLFESVRTVGGFATFPAPTFYRLLRCAALNGNADAALHIFAQLERTSHGVGAHVVYRFLTLAFVNAGRYEEAESTFRLYLEACRAGNVQDDRLHQVATWNVMIEGFFRAGTPEKAISLVDQMLGSTASDSTASTDIPVVTSSTLCTVIAGFVNHGDIQSALAWFDKLLLQEKAPSNPYIGLGGNAMRPDAVAWGLIIDGLAQHGDVQNLNRLFNQLLSLSQTDNVRVLSVHRSIVFHANMNNLKNLSDVEATKTLEWLLSSVINSEHLGSMVADVYLEFIARGQCRVAFDLFHRQLVKCLAEVERSQTSQESAPSDATTAVQRIQYDLVTFTDALFSSAANGKDIPFLVVLDVSRLYTFLSLKPSATLAPYFLHSYGQAEQSGVLPVSEMRAEDWSVLLDFAVEYELAVLHGTTSGLPTIPNFAFAGLLPLLQDIATRGIQFASLDVSVAKRVIDVLRAGRGDELTKQAMENLGVSYIQAFEDITRVEASALENSMVMAQASPVASIQAQQSQVDLEEYPPLHVNAFVSRSIEETLRGRDNDVAKRAAKAYSIFEKALAKGTAPAAHTISRLIQTFGRLNELDKVRTLYTVAQNVLASSPSDQQFETWVTIEDNMIIALAHSSHVDMAHIHRMRILENGGSPSADAYGVLIQYVRDTTDDTSGAMALFQEAMERGVQPNLYLYNNIISKLAKARKADYALELFQQMKACGIMPSSITYGAVIGACARVGDVVSAQTLFQEMVKSKGFKPRVPPYNTMMQLHTTTKPNRASALYYYDLLLQSGVRPSAHTYKLLLDAYGAIEPVDLTKMQRVFDELLADPSVPLTGAHFASLINAYGCVSKDLPKALSIFDSLFPSASGSQYPRNPPLPDAVVYEAVLNAIVAHKRTDLIPVYVAKMNEQGVHMTAYVANFLIKGYANVGAMDRAREIFESLMDPPSGLAAPGNHIPHQQTQVQSSSSDSSDSAGSRSPSSTSSANGSVDTAQTSAPSVSEVMEPVYREPSTWEVMVRAELGAGNREAALALLERLRARQYPEAVYNRISGVLTDHSDPSLA